MSLETPAPSPSKEELTKQHPDQLADRFEDAWQAGETPDLAFFLQAASADEQSEVFRELLRIEMRHRIGLGESLEIIMNDCRRRFPAFHEQISQVIDLYAPLPLLPVPPGRFHAGDRVSGRYRIVSLLGRGGMGEVYLADDLKLGVPVALKFLFPKHTTDPAWVGKLREEVRQARKVTHDAVCRVHDIVEQDGLVFLTMEYIEGDNLAVELCKLGRAPRDTVVGWAWTLCESLAAIHDCGLVHCDLKPSNIILDRKGKVHIVDLGLSRQASQGNALGGTLAYMAPEQYAAGQVSAISDVYSLGLILYELASGRRPFPTGNPDSQERSSSPRAPSEWMRGDGDFTLDRAILRCLEFAPANRPESMRHLQRQLPPLSPAGTQALEGSGALRPLWALVLLGATLAILVLQGLLAQSVLLLHQLPGKNSPKKLTSETRKNLPSPKDLPSKARKILEERFGLSRYPNSSDAWGFAWDVQLIQDIQKRSDADRSKDVNDDRNPILYFWYRESPNELVPTLRYSPADPAPHLPGMRCVILDLLGDLVEYRAVPDNYAEKSFDSPRLPTRGAAGQAVNVADLATWEENLFDTADLDPDKFTRTAASHVPPVFADQHSAWSGKVDERELYIEMAAYKGKPVYFQLWRPKYSEEELNLSAILAGTALGSRSHCSLTSIVTAVCAVELSQRVKRESRIDDPSHLDLADHMQAWAWSLLAASSLASVVLVKRNLKRRWVDSRGTIRVVLFYLLVLLCGAALNLLSSFGSLQAMRKMTVVALGTAAFWSVVLAISYMAFEPYLRRRWPARFTAWNRFLNGHLRDPLVGRDILLGVLFGVTVALFRKLLPLIDSWMGMPSWLLERPLGLPISTPNVQYGWLGYALSSAIVLALISAMLLLLLVWVLRREWLAVVVLAALVANLHAGSNLGMYRYSPLMRLEGFATPMLLYIFLIRFGLLATVVGWFAGLVALAMPLTFWPEEWYIGASTLGFTVLIVLACYGAVIAMGDHFRLPELS